MLGAIAALMVSGQLQVVCELRGVREYEAAVREAVSPGKPRKVVFDLR